MTNTPHLTLVAAPVITEAAERAAVEALAGLLPVTVRTSGLLLLGARKLTVARVVDVDDALVAAVLRIRAAVDLPQHPGWLPHLTLARRLPRSEAQQAVEVLGHEDLELSLTELRRWDPDLGTVRARSAWRCERSAGASDPAAGRLVGGVLRPRVLRVAPPQLGADLRVAGPPERRQVGGHGGRTPRRGEQVQEQRHPAVGERGRGRASRRPPGSAPPAPAGRRRSPPAPSSRWAPRPARAPARRAGPASGHGSSRRSAASTSTRRRSRAPRTRASSGPSQVSTPASRASSPTSGQGAPSARCRKASRRRSAVAASVQGSIARPSRRSPSRTARRDQHRVGLGERHGAPARSRRAA